MCGVAGVLGRRGAAPVPLETLRRMVAMVGHRGPDGHGLYRDARIGLAHARLSIIDLAGGSQPLANEDGTVWISFNGEIFNHVELRRELEAKGHEFATTCDTEVIVHLYEEHGEGAWARLNGQFAFALWDQPRARLWLVRDRLGILPMHYAVSGGRVVFASEVKAIAASGAVDVAIDPAAVAEAFTRWSVASPRSLFAGVQSVRPGTAVRFDDDLEPVEERYWQLDFSEDPELRRLTLDEAADALDERLTESVRLRLRADVPVGAYLSGGLDSSVIGALVRSADSSPLQTFAVGFADAAFDETPEQRAIAAVLGTEHHEIQCRGADIPGVIDDVVWHCEAPLLRTAPAPLFVLSGLVRDKGMKVVLTGEGADELFAGYSIFKEDKIRRFWARDPESLIRPKLLSRVHGEVGAGAARDSELWARFFGRGLTDTANPLYSHAIRWSNTAWSRRVLSPRVRSSGDDLDAALVSALPPGFDTWRPLARAQWLEIETFMSPYLLACQGDRVAMAHGVEVRYPFLDPSVVELATRLPDRLKLPALRDKVALRRLAERRLPSEIANRPKVPYRAPMTAPFFEADGGAAVAEALSPAACARYDLVDAGVAARLLDKARRLDGRMSGEREEMALVGMLTLQVLARSFVDELPARVRARRAALDGSQLRVLVDRVGSASPEQVTRGA